MGSFFGVHVDPFYVVKKFDDPAELYARVVYIPSLDRYYGNGRLGATPAYFVHQAFPSANGEYPIALKNDHDWVNFALGAGPNPIVPWDQITSYCFRTAGYAPPQMTQVWRAYQKFKHHGARKLVTLPWETENLVEQAIARAAQTGEGEFQAGRAGAYADLWVRPEYAKADPRDQPRGKLTAEEIKEQERIAAARAALNAKYHCRPAEAPKPSAAPPSALTSGNREPVRDDFVRHLLGDRRRLGF
jgi:hypothetical protein